LATKASKENTEPSSPSIAASASERFREPVGIRIIIITMAFALRRAECGSRAGAVNWTTALAYACMGPCRTCRPKSPPMLDKP